MAIDLSKNRVSPSPDGSLFISWPGPTGLIELEIDEDGMAWLSTPEMPVTREGIPSKLREALGIEPLDE